MLQPQLNTLFDQQAAGYDARWAKTAPIRDAIFIAPPAGSPNARHAPPTFRISGENAKSN